MKIEFSKNELKALIELLYLGEYMFSVSEKDYPEEKDKYTKVLQKIFKEADSAGLKEHVAHIDRHEMGFTFELEENEDIREIVANYENESFWPELIMRFTTRDVIEKVGAEKFLNMEPSEQIAIRFDTEEVYEREFEKYGVKNLKILNTDLPF
ncbi:hypothetical protein H8E88_26050 [candidate division KSB1 bacterium]|nr:hypothetical protein [candidate division KSB1 bacterium]